MSDIIARIDAYGPVWSADLLELLRDAKAEIKALRSQQHPGPEFVPEDELPAHPCAWRYATEAETPHVVRLMREGTVWAVDGHGHPVVAVDARGRLVPPHHPQHPEPLQEHARG